MKRACLFLLLSMLALPLPVAGQRVTGVSPSQITLEAGGPSGEIRLKGSDLGRASAARVTRDGRSVQGMSARLTVSGSSATVVLSAVESVRAGSGYELVLTGRALRAPLSVKVAISVQAPPPPPPPADPDADIQVVDITLSSFQAYAGSTVQAQVHLSAAPAEPFAVEVVSANTNAVGTPGQVMVPPGSTSYTFDLQALEPQINPGPVVMPIEIQARKVPYTTGPTVNLTVRPTMAVSYMRFAQNIYVDEFPIAGGTIRGLLVIVSTEPRVGAEYQVSVSGPASAPGTLTFPSGNDRSQTLPVTFEDVSSQQTVTITLDGEGDTSSRTVSVSPGASVASMSVSPSVIVGGGTVELSLQTVALAPSGGTEVDVVSSHPQLIPSQTVAVPQGQTSATATLITAATASAAQVTLTANSGGVEMTRNVTVNPPTVTELTVQDGSMETGSSTTGTVTLSGQAPSPMTLQLSNSQPDVVSIPASATIPAGAYQATFPIQAAQSDGLASPSQSAALTVQGPGGETAQSSVHVTRNGRLATASMDLIGRAGGSSGTGTLTLDAAAGPSGVDVSLAADSPVLLSVPATVHVPAGQTSATFTYVTNDPAEESQAEVTATDGAFNATASLIVYGAVSLESVTVPQQTSAEVPAGGTVTVRMNFNQPLQTGSGIEVDLASSSPAVPLPASFVATQGAVQNRQVQVTAGQVTQDEVVTVTATLDGTSHSATVTILQAPIPTLSASKTELVAGETVDVDLTFDRALPATTEVMLDAGSAPLQIPTSVTVPGGGTSATFQVTSTVTGLASPITAPLTATTSSASATLDLLLTSSGVRELFIEPQVTSVGPQTVMEITVSLQASKDMGPVTVALSSTDPLAVPLPASVIVDPMVGSTTFQITTGSPTAVTEVTLTASAYDVEQSSVLTVNPEG